MTEKGRRLPVLHKWISSDFMNILDFPFPWYKEYSFPLGRTVSTLTTHVDKYSHVSRPTLAFLEATHKIETHWNKPEEQGCEDKAQEILDV